MSVYKDFPGLENLEKKKFKDFQGPARAQVKSTPNCLQQNCSITFGLRRINYAYKHNMPRFMSRTQTDVNKIMLDSCVVHSYHMSKKAQVKE